MAPEVIACDENPDATYDNRVNIILLNSVLLLTLHAYRIYMHTCFNPGGFVFLAFLE